MEAEREPVPGRKRSGAGGLGPRGAPARKSGRSRADRYYPYWMVLPALITLVAVNIYPTIYSIYMSFFVFKPGLRRFAGVRNFANLLTDQNFLGSLRITLIFVTVAVILEMVLGVGLAVLLNRKFRGRSLIRSLLVLPMATTPVAAALGWRIMYNSIYGVFNYLLGLVGIPAQSWLGTVNLALPSVIIIDIWQWTPLVAFIALSGLQSLPESPFEAARIDGANGVQIFRFITLPLLNPILVIAALVRMIDAFKTFDIIYATTEGGPGVATLTTNIYTFMTGLRYANLGYAAALCVVMLLISLTFTSILGRSLKKGI